MQDWEPNSWDVTQWREMFEPEINVLNGLESLAEWTVKNENNKSKRRKVKTARKWITGRLRAKFEMTEGYSSQSRAQDDLAKPAWERLGHDSEEEYDRIQHQTYLESTQNGLALNPDKFTPAAQKAVADARALLEAMPEPKVEVIERLDMLHHEHEFKFSYLAGMICRCGVFQEQFMSPILKEVRR